MRVPAEAAAIIALAAAQLVPTHALAQGFAHPPDGEAVAAADPRFEGAEADDRYGEGFLYHPESTVRLFVGPALRLDGETADGGLFAAVDIGEGPAGARFSGSWVQAGSDRGLSQYMGELWLDFGHHKRLHPIVGAGAGVARVEAADSTGGTTAGTVGLGLLRAGLQYLLPVDGTDARASVEVIGSLPAVRGEDGPDVGPWVLTLATVGVGF